MHDLRKTNVGRHGPHHLPLFSRPCNKNFKFYTKQPPSEILVDLNLMIILAGVCDNLDLAVKAGEGDIDTG